jgi:hypothetical protein
MLIKNKENKRNKKFSVKNNLSKSSKDFSPKILIRGLSESNRKINPSKLQDIKKRKEELEKSLSSLNKIASHILFHNNIQEQIKESPFLKGHVKKTESLLNPSIFNRDKESKEMRNINNTTEQQYYHQLDAEEKKFYNKLSREEKDWFLEMGTGDTATDYRKIARSTSKTLDEISEELKQTRKLTNLFNF